MYDNDSRGISYTAGFFMLIAFVIGGLTLASALSALIWHQVTGKSILELQNGFSDPANTGVMKIIQSITAVFGFFIPTFIAATLLNKRPVKLIGFSAAGIRLNQVVLAVLLVGSALLVSSSLSYFTNHIPIPEVWKIRFDKMELEYNTQVSAIISLKNAKDYILALIIMGFLPALCEETLFRGGLQNFLTRGTRNPWLSIAVVSILFSLAHFSFYGFLSRFFLGLVLGALYYYSGKLWLSIVAHFINNALAITLLYLSTQQGEPLQEAIKQDATSYWGILAIPLVIVLFVAFKRASVPGDCSLGHGYLFTNFKTFPKDSFGGFLGKKSKNFSCSMAFNWQTFRTRTLTAAIFVLVMLTGLLWNHWSFLVLFSIIHFGCWWEYLRLMERIHTTSLHIYSKLGFMLLGYGLMLWFCGSPYQIAGYGVKENFSLPVSVAGFIMLITGVFQKVKVDLKTFGSTALGLLYISLSWGLMLNLYDFKYSILSWIEPYPSGIDTEVLGFNYAYAIPIIIIISIWINDTMAYIVGSLIGRTPFSKISPKKTWEGTIGGMILCVAFVGIIAPKMFELNTNEDFLKLSKYNWYILAGIAAITGTFGDLLESKLKRKADVKDSGHIMPGHGGFLDRFDSLLIATPFVWLYVNLIMI